MGSGVKNRIREAGLEIFSRKAAESVTTEEIIKAANVAKASFYAHYRDKYDLMAQIFINLMRSSGENKSKNWHEIAVAQVKTIKDNFDLFRNILCSDPYFYVFFDVTKILTQWFNIIVSRNGGDINGLEIRCAIHKLSISSTTALYELAFGRISYEQFYNLVYTWKSTCPYVLYPYLNFK